MLTLHQHTKLVKLPVENSTKLTFLTSLCKLNLDSCCSRWLRMWRHFLTFLGVFVKAVKCYMSAMLLPGLRTA